MVLSPRDTAALRATAVRQFEDIVDSAIRVDSNLDDSGRPRPADRVAVFVPPGLITKAEWDVSLRPAYLTAGWWSAEWGRTDDDREFVELWANPPDRRGDGE